MTDPQTPDSESRVDRPGGLPYVFDPARLAAVDRSGLGDSLATPAYDSIAELAAHVGDAPISLVSIVNDTHQRFKAMLGLSEEALGDRGTPLSHSICSIVVETRRPLVVTDALADVRVRDNGAVTDLGIRAYAGVPIEFEGHTLGSLCLLDSESREWPAATTQLLQTLSAAVAAEAGRELNLLRLAHATRMQRARVLEFSTGVLSLVSSARIAHRIGDADSCARALESAESTARQAIDAWSHELRDQLDATADAPRNATPEFIDPRIELLSEREHDVLQLLGAGLRNREIAARLGVSAETVKKHVSSILRKLDVGTRAAAAAIAASQHRDAA